jgi:hypothetical protein
MKSASRELSWVWTGYLEVALSCSALAWSSRQLIVIVRLFNLGLGTPFYRGIRSGRTKS